VAAPSTNTDRIFCWVDGIGFTDEGRFVHHLHEATTCRSTRAAASELVGGDVFFGY
jgi:hypothetical protein